MKGLNGYLFYLVGAPVSFSKRKEILNFLGCSIKTIVKTGDVHMEEIIAPVHTSAACHAI